MQRENKEIKVMSITTKSKIMFDNYSKREN